MFNLYFENARGEERLLGTFETYRDCCEEMNKFMKEHDFECYYIRNWIENGRIVADVGSHFEFFYIGRADGTPIKNLAEV